MFYHSNETKIRILSFWVAYWLTSHNSEQNKFLKTYRNLEQTFLSLVSRTELQQGIRNTTAMCLCCQPAARWVCGCCRGLHREVCPGLSFKSPVLRNTQCQLMWDPSVCCEPLLNEYSCFGLPEGQSTARLENPNRCTERVGGKWRVGIPLG